MRIVIVTESSVWDVNNWAGIPYFIAKTLKKSGHEVINVTTERFSVLNFVAKQFQDFAQLLGFSINPQRTKFYLSRISRHINQKVQDAEPDLILGIVASGPLSVIDHSAPIIHVSDATYALMVNYYPQFSNIPKLMFKQGHQIEQRVLDNASLAVVSSTWAARSVEQDYGIDPKKIITLPFGPNVTLPPNQDRDFSEHNRCNILFVGKNWDRKGGSTALKTLELLNKESNEQYHLFIIGCKPPSGTKIPINCTIHPYIDKSVKEERNLYDKILNEASVFLLPTKAECYGIVFVEAAAYGLPVVAPDTGGISSAVDHMKTGFLVPEGSPPEAFAHEISKLWKDKPMLQNLSDNARKKVETELNWDNWVDGLMKESKALK